MEVTCLQFMQANGRVTIPFIYNFGTKFGVIEQLRDPASLGLVEQLQFPL
jgi:hypothetical protein